MAKSIKKSNETSGKQLFKDDYENFGYDIANAKRHNSRNNSKRKFKDYTKYDD